MKIVLEKKKSNVKTIMHNINVDIDQIYRIIYWLIIIGMKINFVTRFI